MNGNKILVKLCWLT